MLLNAAAEIFVYRLHHVEPAVGVERGGKRFRKRLLLLGGGHRRRDAEQPVDQLGVDLRGVAAVIERVIDVRPPVVERREQEAERGRGDRLPGGYAAEGALLGKVPQRDGGILHGADRADDETEHLVAGLVRLAVRAAVRHVVGVAREQNEIVLPLHIERGDDARIQLVPGRLVGAGALAQRLEQPVLVAAGDLLCFKRDVDEIASERAGERFAQQRQIRLLLLLPRHAERNVRFRDDLAAAVDEAAVHAGNAAPLRTEPAAKLVEFLLIHYVPLKLRK